MALIGNTATARELLKILELRNDLTLGDLKGVFSLAKQQEVVGLLTEHEAETRVAKKGGGRKRGLCSFVICCGGESQRRSLYDDSSEPRFRAYALRSTLYDRSDLLFHQKDEEDNEQQYIQPSFPLPHINARYYYDRQHVLGTGRTSQVFLGYRDNDRDLKVAVKWVFRNHCTVSPAELDIGKQIWRESGSPSFTNVVPVYDWSVDSNAYFIVMELATGNLYEAIEGDNVKPQEILDNCVSGLKWLHDRDIIHNELKPENILLFRYDETDKVRVVAKIGDFGISHRVGSAPGQRSVQWDSGIEPWMSPELISSLNDGKPFVGTQEMDIYSLGAIYQFCLIDEDEPSQKPINPTSENLLKWMMKTEPQYRPTISQVREHPAFWNEKKCLAFLEDVSRSFSDKKCRDCLAVRKEINDCYKIYHRTRFDEELDWKPVLEDSPLLERIPNTRKKTYETDLIFSLVELIRDKAEHYQEMKKEVKVVLFNDSPYDRKEYAHYFLSRFPYLVINLFCKLTTIVDSRECLATLKKQYFMRFLGMDYKECWSDDENIRVLLNC